VMACAAAFALLASRGRAQALAGDASRERTAMHWSLSLAFAGVGLAGAALDRKPTPFLLGPDARVLGHYDAAADDLADALVVVDAVALLPAIFALTPQRQNAQTL